MKAPAWLRRLKERLGAMSLQQRLLHGAGFVLVLVALQVLGQAGGGVPGAVGVVVIALALGMLVAPDSPLAMVVIGAIVWMWLVFVHDPATPWALAEAVVLLGVHATTALASGGPLGVRFDRVTWLRWGVRSVVVVLVTALVWLGVRVLAAAAVPGTVALTAAGLGVLAVLALAARFVGLRRTPR